MSKLQTIIAVVIGVFTIISISYGGFKFYSCKADREELKLKADLTQLELVQNDLYIYKLQQRRKYVQERIWDIQRTFPNTYMNNVEYRNLVQELRQIDVEINAYYQRKKK